jgi:hypothetical protein
MLGLENHCINFGHYILAYILAFGIVPKLIFTRQYKDELENIVSNYIKAVLFFIISGLFAVFNKIV